MEEIIKGQFPLLEGENAPIYFDNMECTVPAKCVIEKIIEYYSKSPFGVRGVHKFAVRNKIEMDDVRKKIANFLNADSEEIIFTKDVSESSAIISSSLPKSCKSVILSEKAHNSIFVPWLNMKRKIEVRILTDDFKIKENEVVVIPHVSHIDGSEMDLKKISKEVHDRGGYVFSDLSFSIPNRKIDVKKIDIDFGTFSFHRMCGPVGVSVLYMKKEIADEIRPLIVGGGTVSRVSHRDFALLSSPERYEAGHLDYASVFGSAVCIDFLNKIGIANIYEHVINLNKVLTSELSDMSEVRIMGPKDYRKRGAICNFTIEKLDSHDVAMIMEEVANIVLRSGMHCAHAYFRARKMTGAVGVSFYIYNKEEDVIFLAENLKKMIKEFT